MKKIFITTILICIFLINSAFIPKKRSEYNWAKAPSIDYNISHCILGSLLQKLFSVFISLNILLLNIIELHQY